MTLCISPLVAGGFAAEATGVDLRGSVDADVAGSLRRAFLDHPVLVVRTNGLTSAQLLALAEVFGEPQEQLLEGYRSSDTPAISIIASASRRKSS